MQAHGEHRHPARPSDVLHSAVNFAGERVIHTADQQAERQGPAASPAQAACSHIHVVIECSNGIPDPSRRLRRNPRFVIDHPRDGLGAYPGQRRDLLHSRSPSWSRGVSVARY